MKHENINIRSCASIAVLVDLENLRTADFTDSIAMVSRILGRPRIVRSFGNCRKSDFGKVFEDLSGIDVEPIHTPKVAQGKNASDIALVVNAMELAFTRSIHTFVIISSDSDFTPLARFLRSNGNDVIGIGRSAAPEALQCACTQFVPLNEGEQAITVEPASKPEPAPVQKVDTPPACLLDAVRAVAVGNDAMLSLVASHLNSKKVDWKSWGKGKQFKAVFNAYPQHFELSDQNRHVRLRKP